MLDKFKQMKKLKDLQKKLKEQEESVEKEGVKVTVSGDMKIVDVELNSDLDENKQERLVKECFNEAIKKIQKNVAGSFGG